MSINDISRKIKPFIMRGGEAVLRRDLFTLMLIILVGIASFGLGRLSISKGEDSPIMIERAPLTASVLATQNTQLKTVTTEISSIEPMAKGGGVIGTKSTKKYRFPWCPSTATESNKVYFKSIEEARSAGYTPVKNCKGLE